MSHQPTLVGTLPERAPIDAILAATGRQRQHLLDDFMRSKLRVFRSIGHTLCRNASMDVTRHLDEATAIVAAECVVMMNEIIADPTRLEKVTSFDGKLWVRCRPVFRTYCDSAAGGVNATGAIALSRRKREMGRMRESLRASYDREPTNEEIVEATNVKMNATRKNAARQAMVCSVDDLRTDPVAYSLTDHDVASHTNDGLIVTHEAAGTIAAVIKVCEQTSPHLGAIARSWLGDLYNPALEMIRTPAQIAEHLDLPPAVVHRQLANARVVARSYLADFLSITQEIYQGGDPDETADHASS
jgi:hypothetical protein